MPDYNGWTTITVDLVSIMETFCISGGAALRYKAIRRVQVCSTMLIRDVVTADRDILTGKKALPKELAVKTDFGLNGMVMWNAFEECVALSTSTMKSKPKTSSRFSGKPQNAASSPSSECLPLHVTRITIILITHPHLISSLRYLSPFMVQSQRFQDVLRTLIPLSKLL
jgi:hypothetical protein